MKNKFLFCGGVLLIAAALCFTAYNLWDEKRAGDSVEELLWQYQELQSAPRTKKTEESRDFGMPVVEIDDNLYIGVLEIPLLDISLPVMDEWDYDRLKTAPCRYEGAVSLDNMIIAAHNYRSHFGRLHKLEIGDEVAFIDVEDNRIEYQVTEVIYLNGSEVDEIENGEWDLTLFTCSIDSQRRIVVRCARRMEGEDKDV